MAKYHCNCGINFRKEKDAKKHVENHEILQLSCAFSDIEVMHSYYKKDWLTRYCEFSADWYRPFWWRSLSIIAIHSVFISHFKYTLWEAMISGLAVGILTASLSRRNKE